MALADVFSNGVEIAFNVFNDAVKEAEYSFVIDDGWGITSETKTRIRLIVDSFTQDDITTLSFSDLIQPTDIKGLVPGVDLDQVVVSTNDIITIDDVVYGIEGFETDPYNVLYILLLRRT